jgi:ribosomal protein S18 acetylase RimI-like enzyme
MPSTARSAPTVAIRDLDTGDRELVLTGLRSLSADTLRRRFGYRFAPGEEHVAWVRELGGPTHVAVGACASPDVPVGVARAVIAPGGGEAEVAAVVADAWQRHGLGSALMAALATRLAQRGVTTVRAEVAVGNDAAIAVMRSIGARREGPVADGAMVMRAALPARAPARPRCAASGRRRTPGRRR